MSRITAFVLAKAMSETPPAAERQADGRDTFHPTTVTILKYVLDEQRRDLALYQRCLEQADETSLKTDAERERFPRVVATFRQQIEELTAVVADLEELLRLIAQADAEAEQERQIAEDERVGAEIDAAVESTGHLPGFDDGGALNDNGRDYAEEDAVRRAVCEEGGAELADDAEPLHSGDGLCPWHHLPLDERGMCPEDLDYGSEQLPAVDGAP